MPQTSASLGQSAAWATLVGHSGLVVDAGDDDCWVTTIEDEQTPANRGYLVIACVRFHTELRPRPFTEQLRRDKEKKRATRNSVH